MKSALASRRLRVLHEIGQRHVKVAAVFKGGSPVDAFLAAAVPLALGLLADDVRTRNAFRLMLRKCVERVGVE